MKSPTSSEWNSAEENQVETN